MQILGVNVGFRPARKGGPVLREWPADEGRPCEEKVVLGYGFGGYGYQTSWGVAFEARKVSRHGDRVDGYACLAHIACYDSSHSFCSRRSTWIVLYPMDMVSSPWKTCRRTRRSPVLSTFGVVRGYNKCIPCIVFVVCPSKVPLKLITMVVYCTRE